MDVPVYSREFRSSPLFQQKSAIETAIEKYLNVQAPLSRDYEDLYNLALYLIDTLAEAAGWGHDYAHRQFEADNMNYFKAGTAIACVLLQFQIRQEPKDNSSQIEFSELAETIVIQALEVLQAGSVIRMKIPPVMPLAGSTNMRMKLLSCKRKLVLHDRDKIGAPKGNYAAIKYGAGLKVQFVGREKKQ